MSNIDFMKISTAGSWCAADDGDEEIIELRSCGDVPWRKHLTEAESPPPTKPVAPDTTTTVSVQSHPRVHTSLPLSYSQSQSLAQTSASNAETETDLSEYQHGSRFNYSFFINSSIHNDEKKI